MPAGPYETRERNSKWNPGLPDLSNKARANIERQRQTASATTTTTGEDSDVLGNNPESQRPKPRGIFNSGARQPKSTQPAAIVHVTADVTVDAEMADVSGSVASSGSQVVVPENSPSTLPPVAAQVENGTHADKAGGGASGPHRDVQVPTSHPTSNGVEEGVKARLRRASASEGLASSLKRKNPPDLDRQPAKKPNSAPYRSTNFSTSSIESGGVYDDWRDRVNKFNVNTAATHSHNGITVREHPDPGGEESESSAGNKTTSHDHNGITVRERDSGIIDDEDRVDSSVPRPKPRSLNAPIQDSRDASKTTASKDLDVDTTGADDDQASDALGHGFLVSAVKSSSSSNASHESPKSRSNSRHSSEDYEEQDKRAREARAAKNKCRRIPKWVNVDSDEGVGGQGNNDLEVKPGNNDAGCGPSNGHDSDLEISELPFPPLAQPPRRSNPSLANSQPTRSQQRTPASMAAPTALVHPGRQARAIAGRRRGNGRASRGLLRNRERNSGLDEPQAAAHPRAAGRASSTGSNNELEINKRKFTIQDLPLSDAGLQKWTSVMIPRWIDFIFTVSENPWQPGDVVSDAQRLWDMTMYKVDHQVAAVRDPVYSLLRQKLYEFRGRMADRAEHAVETYFDSFHKEHQNSQSRADYVQWAVPRNTTQKDKFGSCIVVKRPQCLPFMWRISPPTDEESSGNDEGGEGPFQHQCILNTFALFLEITEHLPIEYRQIGHGGFPRAALALATAAVERAFSLWQEGDYEPLLKSQSRFDQRRWGFATLEFMESIVNLSEDIWQDILESSRKFKFMYSSDDQYVTNYFAKELEGESSGRSMCY